MRAYALVASGSITLATIAEAKALKRKKSQGPKLPAIIAPITRKEIKYKISRSSKFSGKGWAGPTKSMIRVCKTKVSDAAVKDIIREAKEVSRVSRRFAKEDDDESDFDNDDSILDLHNGSDDSSDENITLDRHMKNTDGQKKDGSRSSDDCDDSGDSDEDDDDDMMAGGFDDEADCDLEEDGGGDKVIGHMGCSDIEEDDDDADDDGVDEDGADDNSADDDDSDDDNDREEGGSTEGDNK